MYFVDIVVCYEACEIIVILLKDQFINAGKIEGKKEKNLSTIPIPQEIGSFKVKFG
jgi:hypothetical protein